MKDEAFRADGSLVRQSTLIAKQTAVDCCLVPRLGALFIALLVFILHPSAFILASTSVEVSSGPQARLFLDRLPAPQEIARRDTRALYEPATGCYLGAYIDFDGSLHPRLRDQNHSPHCDPAEFEGIVGKPHSMYFFYLGYGKRLPMDWVRQLAARNKFVHIALEPNHGLEKVKNDRYLQQLADDMRLSGAKIFLRFASEMNGVWTNYHKDPALYRRKFKLVHDVMHQRAPNVALVWCPYSQPDGNIERYYPGDAATDWVGVNMYSVTYHENHRDEPAENEHACDLLEGVYRRHAKRKPIMICEFAATHFAACDARPRADFAARKIATLYSALPRLYPRVKCINYFDGNAIQFAGTKAYNDYSVTNDRAITAAYHNGIASPYFYTAPQPARAAPNAPIPMAIRQGEILRGRVRLSCWARGAHTQGSDKIVVRYCVDGYTIYQARQPDQWECFWDAGSVRPGKHVLRLDVLNGKGKVVATQSVRVRCQP